MAALETKRRQYARLEGHLARAVEANPDAALGRLQLGDTLRLQGKLEAARAQYLKAAALYENCTEVYLKLARTAEALNRPEEARSHLDMALRIAPDDPHVIALATRLSGCGGGAAETSERLRRAVERPALRREGVFGR